MPGICLHLSLQRMLEETYRPHSQAWPHMILWVSSGSLSGKASRQVL